MIKNRCICSLLCVFMCVYGCCCVHLAHLLPVCDDCTGHSPEPRTATSSWGGARRLEAPAGGSGWETYPSKLERWYRRAEPLNALSLQLSLCFNHQLCRWVDMQWASLTPKRKTSHFNTAYQNIDLFCVTSFSLSYCRTLYLGKKKQSSCWTSFIAGIQVGLFCSSLGKQCNKMEDALCLLVSFVFMKQVSIEE